MRDASIGLTLAWLLAGCGAGTSGHASPDEDSGPEGSRDAGTVDAAMGAPDAPGATRDSGGTDAQQVPDAQVGACSSLAASGTWEQVTPPTVAPQLPGPGDCTYGTGAFVLDPVNEGTVYLGTCQMGMWKTTDCGASWAHVNVGVNGGALDNGRQWTFAIDPVDSQTLYTNSGYNAWIPSGTWAGNGVSGAFKSTNGGVDWQGFWPPADGTFASAVNENFVGQVVMDPTDHEHLLVSFHATCNPPYPAVCVAETKDAGATWSIVNGDSSWVGDEGQTVWFLGDSQTWLYGSASNGLWRTTDAGSTWTLIDSSVEGHGGGQLYRSSAGAWYLAITTGILRSPDGISWTILPNSGDTMAGVTGDGTTMWASRGFPWNQGQGPAPYLPFWSSPESDGMTWTQMQTPLLSNGGTLLYDPGHHILYSSDEYAGFWRVVTGS